MQILNDTKKTILSSEVKVCLSWWDKLTGLLNPKNPRTLVFYTRYGIHTLFLSQPIDVLILDSSFRVVKLKGSLLPFRFFFWNPKYSIVIELPQHTLQKTLTELMDTLYLD